jgi:hypothetical protein
LHAIYFIGSLGVCDQAGPSCHISLIQKDFSLKTLTLAAAIFASSLAMSPALAGPAADALSSCVAENTTGKDRKDLAQWIFIAMSSHPEMKRMSTVSAATREEFDKTLANLATKLITESCGKEAKRAVMSEGNESFKAAFGLLGQLAMQELMSDPSVNASFSNYTKYLDQSKFEATFSNK